MNKVLAVIQKITELLGHVDLSALQTLLGKFSDLAGASTLKDQIRAAIDILQTVAKSTSNTLDDKVVAVLTTLDVDTIAGMIEGVIHQVNPNTPQVMEAVDNSTLAVHMATKASEVGTPIGTIFQIATLVMQVLGVLGLGKPA